MPWIWFLDCNHSSKRSSSRKTLVVRWRKSQECLKHLVLNHAHTGSTICFLLYFIATYRTRPRYQSVCHIVKDSRSKKWFVVGHRRAKREKPNSTVPSSGFKWHVTSLETLLSSGARLAAPLQSMRVLPSPAHAALIALALNSSW